MADIVAPSLAGPCLGEDTESVCIGDDGPVGLKTTGERVEEVPIDVPKRRRARATVRALARPYDKSAALLLDGSLEQPPSPPPRSGYDPAATPAAAARSASTSSLRIWSMACIARSARSESGSLNTSSMPSGTTCHAGSRPRPRPPHARSSRGSARTPPGG